MVDALWQAKTRRQVAFASHNATGRKRRCRARDLLRLPDESIDVPELAAVDQRCAANPVAVESQRRVRPYPPWWIERSAQRRKLLDAGVARLRSLLPTLNGVRAAVVFGSYARGTVGPESDLDILLIRDTTLPPHRRADDIYADADLGVPFDLVVYTPAEFERLRQERPFVMQAANEGIWIDAAPSR